MSKVNINIASDFTTTPGARKKADGDFSGEVFREKFLEDLFKIPNDDRIIEITLDGVEGYPTSFLEESFGGLARRYGKERCKKKLKFISVEDNLLIKEIESYIEKCDD